MLQQYRKRRDKSWHLFAIYVAVAARIDFDGGCNSAEAMHRLWLEAAAALVGSSCTRSVPPLTFQEWPCVQSRACNLGG